MTTPNHWQSTHPLLSYMQMVYEVDESAGVALNRLNQAHLQAETERYNKRRRKR